jgi:DNA-binding response OmpR family regulator
MDGLAICQKLREDKNNTPILILTAKGQIMDRVEGLNTGADDYLTKPFAFEELLARVKALVRRPNKILENKIKVEDLVLDIDNFTVERAGKNIQLSAKEFSLLEYLMRNVGKTLKKQQIINHVWNYDSDILPNTVEVFIGYLRNKIDEPFENEKPIIHTIRGFGYKLGK